ncbi:hypothetical protein BHE74_00045539 [Ensete ventricosum]|nr:hypothetical protein BHE74_00045539 [Ensete ventricosum]RZS17638.1 hypothetical protein BHM03_00049806 [Ensete ventricosum]
MVSSTGAVYYHPKLVGNDRLRSPSPVTGRYQPREKEEEGEGGEEKGEPGDPMSLSLDDPDPSPPSLARHHI